MSDTCYSYKKVLFHTIQWIETTTRNVDCCRQWLLFGTTEWTCWEKSLWSWIKSEEENYLKYWEYMLLWQPCDIYIYRKTENVIRHLQNFTGWERTSYKNAATSICWWTISWVISTRWHVTVCVVCCTLKNWRSFFPECQECMIPTFSWHYVNGVGWPCFPTSGTTILISVHPLKQ